MHRGPGAAHEQRVDLVGSGVRVDGAVFLGPAQQQEHLADARVSLVKRFGLDNSCSKIKTGVSALPCAPAARAVRRPQRGADLRL